MIGFNHLGRQGRLGNQMFQYAATKGIAANRGYEFIVGNHSELQDDGIGNMVRTEIFDSFNIECKKGYFRQIMFPNNIFILINIYLITVQIM